MNLAPLLTAPAVIQIHAFAALGAFGLGAIQLAAPKGTIPHRTIGWIWAGLMLGVVLSSFFIHTIRLWGPWSPIHLLAGFTLVGLCVAVHAARHHVAVMVEKPLATNLTDALAIRRISREDHVPVLVNYETTWYASNKAAYDELERTLYEGRCVATVIAPVLGIALESSAIINPVGRLQITGVTSTKRIAPKYPAAPTASSRP